MSELLLYCDNFGMEASPGSAVLVRKSILLYLFGTVWIPRKGRATNIQDGVFSIREKQDKNQMCHLNHREEEAK